MLSTELTGIYDMHGFIAKPSAKQAGGRGLIE